MILFDENTCIDIYAKNTNPYVLLAVEDLRKDFRRVNRAALCPKMVDHETDRCLIIEANEHEGNEPIRDEAFTIKSDGQRIVIAADGYLGTMWGIYTFSEKMLGIDPCYLFNDFEIQPCERMEISDVIIEERPSGFGFRGVFINDEDLLTGWKDGGGIRYVEAPCYGVTVERSVIERVVETVLRLRLNLVIPATFLDMDNPPEKLLADCVARRGIYLSQHHVEPVGVSSFTFGNYCRKHGKKAKFSYAECPQTMEEVWKAYIVRWAEYDNVVWQIGLRGVGDDRPLWQDDVPTEEVLRKSGELISQALAKQRALIDEATGGKARYFTSTLWMEGSRLMAEGLLKMPDNTVVVFADNGPCQMYGPDFEYVPRKAGTAYGIYYHVQYYSCGPHLAPLTGPDKLYYNVRRAYDKGDRAYFILNASNVREFVFELGAYSEMMWDPESFSATDYLRRHTAKYCGGQAEQAEALIRKYYEIIPSLDARKFSKHFQRYFNYDFGTDYGAIKNFTAKDGLVIEYGSLLIENFHREMDMERCEEMYRTVKRAIVDYEELFEGFEWLADSAPDPLKKHINVKWLNYIMTMMGLYGWYINLYEAKRFCELRKSEEFKAAVNAACECLETLLEYRKCAEYGEFENWYRGDLKMNVKQHLYDTKGLLGQTPF